MMVSLLLHVQDVVVRHTHPISFALYVSGKMLAEGKVFLNLLYTTPLFLFTHFDSILWL